MIYLTTINPDTLELLKALQQLPVLCQTRLVGGTALALQIGHRKSIDLYLFGKLTVGTFELTTQLSLLGKLTVLKDSSNIHIYSINGIKVDIVNYTYDWLESSYNVEKDIRLANLKDICAMKLAAITGRGTKKDFIDIYFLLKYFSLEEMCSFYVEKYSDGSLFLVLKSLSYFEDAEADPLPFMLTEINWDTVKETIIKMLWRIH